MRRLTARGAIQLGATVLAVALTAACGAPSDRDVAVLEAAPTSAPSDPSPTAANGIWTAMADPPASVAPFAPAVWTGNRVIVWGGGVFADDGTPVRGGSYDPAANTWEELPEAPVEAPGGHTAVWTGPEVIYWGGQEPSRDVHRQIRGSDVAFSPEAKTWRRLATAPIETRTAHEAVWTGTEMIVWGGVTASRCCPVDSVIHDPTAAAYNPETDTWRVLADAPAPWSGGSGSAVSKAFGGDMFVWRDGELARYSVDDDAWQSLGGGPPPKDPEAPFDLSTAGPVSAGAVVDGTFFVWSGGTRAVEGRALGLPGGDGRLIAEAAHFTDFLPRLAAADDAIFAHNFEFDMYEPGEGTSVWRYDIAGDSWERLPNPPAEVGAGATPIWTGQALVILPSTYGDDSKRGTGAVFSKR